jgi:hypothetical protein
MTKHEGLELGHKMAEIAGSNAGETWKELAFDAFKNHAKTHNVFTTEQVRNANPDLPAPPDPRAWGAIALRARKERLVDVESWVRADSRKVHGMVVTLWRSNLV